MSDEVIHVDAVERNNVTQVPTIPRRNKLGRFVKTSNKKNFKTVSDKRTSNVIAEVQVSTSLSETNIPEANSLENPKMTRREQHMDAIRQRLTKDTSFLECFVPELSIREQNKRQQREKIKGNIDTLLGVKAVFDENGKYISSGRDLCDCLEEECCGCFFPCPKCSSNKCGPKCRINRAYKYDQFVEL